MKTSIPPHDEAALDWYFGQGQSLFGRSSSGAMLDRAKLYNLKRLRSCELMDALEARRPNEPPPGQITVRQTGQTCESFGYVPNESALTRYAAVSRRLAMVLERSSDTYRTLAVYYGNEGARWGRSDQGRLFALYPLTSAGAELLRKLAKRKAPDLGLSPCEKLAGEVRLQRVRPMTARRALLDQARREATARYRHACATWLEVHRRCPTATTPP